MVRQAVAAPTTGPTRAARSRTTLTFPPGAACALMASSATDVVAIKRRQLVPRQTRAKSDLKVNIFDLRC
jgi:hypothetical protein